MDEEEILVDVHGIHRDHNRLLNRTAEDHLTDNVNLRDRVAITRANESREHRNENPNF